MKEKVTGPPAVLVETRILCSEVVEDMDTAFIASVETALNARTRF